MEHINMPFLNLNAILIIKIMLHYNNFMVISNVWADIAGRC